jgi:hypothetical protein
MRELEFESSLLLTGRAMIDGILDFSLSIKWGLKISLGVLIKL